MTMYISGMTIQFPDGGFGGTIKGGSQTTAAKGQLGSLLRKPQQYYTLVQNNDYRNGGITYTNTLGRPMVIYVATQAATEWFSHVYINNIHVAAINTYAVVSGACIIVPKDATYRIDCGSIWAWYEY